VASGAIRFQSASFGIKANEDKDASGVLRRDSASLGIDSKLDVY
jgi:hypothetical protein